MKSIVPGIAAGLLLAWAAFAGAEDQIPWAADFRQACEQAAQQKRLVLLHFYSDDCPPCVRVEQNVFSRPEVAAAIARNYVPVKVHVGQNPELATRYQVTRWPTDVAVTPAGLEVHRSTSPQVPEQYVELAELMALKAGVGAGRQWAANMEQVGQATLAQAPDAAQGAAGQLPQQWNQPMQQVAGAADQLQRGAQQWSQQAQGTAQQFGQQAQSGAQQVQQQVQGTAQQFQAGAANAGQQFQQQTQVAGQQFRGAAQQFGETARSTFSQGQAQTPTSDFRAAAGAGVAAAATQAPQFAAGGNPSPPVSVSNPFFGQQPASPPVAANVPPQQSSQPAQQPAQPAPQQFIAASQAPPVSLDGFCPVTLLETKKWKKADPQFGAIHRGRTYLFANADQQKKFLANPDAFAPILSGYDPVHFATTGQLVEGNRAHGLITPGDNRIVLFADESSLEQYKQSPRAYAERAYQAMMQSESTATYR
jgi:thiol-disulfide isomerase/thioredoxin